MFERFTDRARRVVVLAQEEARSLNHNYIGTEHFLLGLIREEEGVAAQSLSSLGCSLDAVRAQIVEVIGRGNEVPAAQIPFTPRSKKVLELALREAKGLGHEYIGTEHILLGLLREEKGVGAQILAKLGADLVTVRERVVQLLGGYAAAAPKPTTDEPCCARCSATLAEHARHAVIEVPDADGENRRPMTFVYCGRCGAVISGQ